MSVGLFIGRFQPFHNGHAKAIEWALEKCGALIIMVGSAQSGNEPGNPLTVDERLEMIGRVVEARGWGGRCRMVGVTDVNDHSEWVGHVDSGVGEYDVIYTNSPLTKKLFETEGKTVVEVPFFERDACEGRSIRAEILAGGKWRDKVPKEVAGYLEEIGFEERLRRIRAEGGIE